MKSSRAGKNVVLVVALFGVLALAHTPAHAALKKIGVLITDNVAYYREIHEAFEKNLAALGNETELVVQRPMRNSLSLVNAAKKLIAMDVDLIVTYGNTATLVVVNETKKIPVVFAGVFDPEGTGLLSANARGISSSVPLVSLLKKFKGFVNFSRLGVVFSKDIIGFDKESVLQAKALKKLEEELHFELVSVNLKAASNDIDKTEAFFMTSSCETDECLDSINGVALRGKVPSAASGGNASKVLLTVAANPQEQGEEAAKIVMQFMGKSRAGASDSRLVRPRKVDVIINMKQATAIGLKVPFDLLTSASQVLE